VSGEHASFGAGVAKADLLDGTDAIADQFGEFYLRLGSRRPCGAFMRRASQRFGDGRISVAMNQAGVVAEQIDIAVAVDVPQERTFAARDREGVWAMIRRRAGVAARHHAFGAGRHFGRVGSLLAKAFLDAVHCHRPASVTFVYVSRVWPQESAAA